jgi:hypothetical protein
MSDEEDEPAGLSFVDPNLAAQQAAAAALGPSDDEDDEPGKKRKRKAKPANAPLDKDGLPMEWDADAGQWVEAVGFTAAPEKLSEQWVQTRLSQTLMHLEKLARGGGVHGSSLINFDELDWCREGLNFAMAGVLRDAAGARQKATASAVFWAIALAQSAAARRPDGWVVDSRDAVCGNGVRTRAQPTALRWSVTDGVAGADAAGAPAHCRSRTGRWMCCTTS